MEFVSRVVLRLVAEQDPSKIGRWIVEPELHIRHESFAGCDFDGPGGRAEQKGTARRRFVVAAGLAPRLRVVDGVGPRCIAGLGLRTLTSRSSGVGAGLSPITREAMNGELGVQCKGGLCDHEVEPYGVDPRTGR